jgi:hypothetical protein
VVVDMNTDEGMVEEIMVFISRTQLGIRTGPRSERQRKKKVNG